MDDVLDVMLLIHRLAGQGFDVYNVATEDHLVVPEIADLVGSRVGPQDVVCEFIGGDRGGRGDVPVVRFNAAKLRSLG